MATGNYTPSSTSIVHSVDVDIKTREAISDPIHLVQYDKKFQVIKINLWQDGTEYALPSNVQVNVRYLKPDHTYVYNQALGVDQTRKSVYIEVTGQMTAASGIAKAIAEISDGDKILGTGTFTLDIDKNPVQEDGIESADEFKALGSYVEDARVSADAARVSQTEAKKSQDAALASQNAAKLLKTLLKLPRPTLLQVRMLRPNQLQMLLTHRERL